MSLTWMLQHVLTHPESKAVGIDPWLMTTKLDSDVMTKVMVRAYQNTLQWQQENRCTLVQGSSAEVLRRMVAKGHVGIKCDSVDLCMIDGNHNDYAAYDDAKQCLDLIKPGGWMLFDDVENQVNKKEHVKQGLEMFVKDYGSRVEFLWKDKYMECYKVL
jgi:predicted O-methyltransferase YrrM